MYISGFERALNKFHSETDWLCDSFSQFAHDTDLVRGQFAGEFVVIRLHDAWARFCRELIVVSAYGKITTLGGTRLATSLPVIKSRGDVIPTLMGMYAKRRNEPSWFSAVECCDAGTRLCIQNLATVSAALGAANSPANHIREIRNFYAHRKKESAIKAVSTRPFLGPHSPAVFRLNDYLPGGATVLETWVQELIAIATAAMQ